MPTILYQHHSLDRPSKRIGAGKGWQQPPFAIVPAVVENEGRSTCCAFSEFDGSCIVGIDVGAPQKWYDSANSFRGWAAGGGTDGVAISYANKKTVSAREGPSYGIWLAGSTNSGAIFRRTSGANKWSLITTTFFGEVNDGGSTDPRRTKGRLICIDGTNVYVACRRIAAPSFGIARSQDSGNTFTAWSFGVTRNFTALMKSPQYNCLYGSADNRAGGGNDGVFIMTGLGGAASVQRIDNVGVNAPAGMNDVRDVFVVQEGTTDTIFVVVGNTAGSDAQRGLWRARITTDPAAGGFTPATDITWSHIFTPGASDRMNAVVAWKPNGASAGPIYMAAVYFNSSTNSSGTYNLSAGAGGGAQNYRVTAVRSLNADVGSPTIDVISGTANINNVTFGQRHVHTIAFIGEPAAENSRMGGTNHSSTDLCLSADGQTLVSATKSTPWISKNPWAATGVVEWRPFSHGLGGLEGGYQAVYIPGDNRFAVVDDDRGLFTFGHQGEVVPEWCIADDVDGFSGTTNACNSVGLAVNGNDLIVGREVDGKAYRVTNPFVYASALATAYNSVAGPGACIGSFEWKDSTNTTRALIVTKNAIYRGTTQVLAITSSATRSDFCFSGPNVFLHIPDLGIYRSTNDGATFTLWWDKAIGNNTTNRYSGHMGQDRDTGTTLWVAFEDGGVWQCVNAHTSGAGSGTAGARPSGTNKVSGGSLAAGDQVSGLGVDPIRGDVWACNPSATGATTSKLHVLRHEDQTTWKDMTLPEFSESCIIPQFLLVYDGFMLIGTGSNGTLRRMC